MSKAFEARFLRRNTIANKPMKKYSTSLVIIEMQIQKTVRDHFSSARVAIIKKRKIHGQ